MPDPSRLHVLIVDDEKNIRTVLSTCLESLGCQVTAVASPDAALTALTHQSFDLAFLDLRLGQVNGLDLIPQLLAESPDLAIVVITAYATVDTAVDAIKRGAKDYLPKPFTPAQIRLIVEQLTEQRRLAHGQFTTTNGLGARWLCACKSRARTPLPVPLSPRKSKGVSARAARATISSTAPIFAEAVSASTSGRASCSWPSRSRIR